MKFIRTGVGDEEKLVRHLKSKNKKSYHFKMFGKYDVLEITRLDELHHALRSHTDCRIRSINSFPFFCWHNNPKDFETSLSESLSPAISLLKLQDIVFQQIGLDGIQKVIIGLKKKHRSFHALVGMGFYEILLWIPSTDFSSIFDAARKLRDYKKGTFFPDFDSKYIDKPLFADTTTIPVISYPNVILKNKWNRLTGNVTPLVKVKCSPGHEQIVAQKWEGQWRPALGSEDLVCLWERPVELSIFAKQLFDNRNEWGRTADVHDTSTKICGNPYKAPEIKLEPVTRQITLNPIKETLTKLLKKRNINQFLIGELINITSLINTYIGNNMEISKTYYDIIASTYFLASMLDEYIEVVTDKNIRYISEIEHELFSYVHCIHSAMDQHFPSKDYMEFSDNNNGVPYSGSISRIIRAISVFPEQLLGIISEGSPPTSLIQAANLAIDETRKESLIKCVQDYDIPWKGFVFLHLAEGYQLLNQGEIIIVPYKDIFEILNWHTMTHEIAHAYYTRIQFEDIEAEWYADWTKNVSSTSDAIGIAINLRNTTNELFAHWFDFRHFFAGKLDLYIWSIWRTWLSVSRIYEHPIEYWHRTLFIRITSQYHAIAPKIAGIRRSTKTLQDQNGELCKLFEPELIYIEDFLKIKFSNKYKAIRLNGQDRSHVLMLMSITVDIICILEENGYINEVLIKSFHSTDDELEELSNVVIKGNIPINTISNPYYLLHKLLIYCYENNTSPTDPVTIAVIFSLWQSSRSFTRTLSINESLTMS